MFFKYSKYKNNISTYPHTAKKMTGEYLILFSKLVKNRDQIIKNRNLFKNPCLLIKNIVFIFLKIKNIVKCLNNTYLNRIFK